MWHLADSREMGVDPGNTVLQASRHLHRAADIARPHRRRQSVLRVIRPFDGLFRVGEARDGDDGAKNFALHYLVGLSGTGDDGRLVEKAASCARTTASRDLDVRKRRGARDEPGDAFALGRRDQRSHFDTGLTLEADLDGAYGAREIGHQAIMDAGTGV